MNSFLVPAEFIPILAADGLTNGAVYALLALALVLVFAVTRVIFVPQGEFVMFGTLTLATLQQGQTPKTLYLVMVLLVVAAILNTIDALRHKHPEQAIKTVLLHVGFALLLWIVVSKIAPLKLALGWQVILTLLLVVPLGPLLYRSIYQPLKNASVLVLLIASVALHLALVGLGLAFFGPEGSNTPAFAENNLNLLGLELSGQQLLVIVFSALVMGALATFFQSTLAGKSLRATAVNRLGARLVGIRPEVAGSLAFTLAALIGALSGILIGPKIAVGYDTGFLIGLKGFVGAIIGGLISFPLAAIGAVMVGLIESFASFSLSQWKEVIVFTMILPVLLWRSLTSKHHDEEEEE